MKDKPASERQPMSVRRSLAMSFARKYTNMALTIPTIMVVSRLLTPAELGVYSVGMAFVTLVHSMRDFGTSDYIVRAEVLEDNVAQSAFTINLLIAWVLGVVMFVCSGWVATFYREPGLQLLLQILSINFFLLPFGSTVNAMLKRSMQFGIIYQINLAQQATQSGITVLLAYYGFGYLGLGVGSVAGMVATIIACLTIGRAYRITGLSLQHWRDISSFGLQRTLGDASSKIGASAPDFIIGRVLDFTAVGLFSRGKGLVNMFQQNVLGAIGIVTFPTYARDFRKDNTAHVLYLKSVTYVTAITWPFLLFSGLMGFSIMRIMFGDQWDAAVPLLQLFTIAGSISVINMDAPQLLVAIGRVGAVTRTIMLVQVIRVASLIVAAFYGLMAVAAVSIAMAVINIILYQRVIDRHTPLTPAMLARALWPSAVTTFCSLLVPVLVVFWMPPAPDNIWPPLLIGLVGAGLGWLVGLKISGHALGEELSGWLAKLIQKIRKARAQ